MNSNLFVFHIAMVFLVIGMGLFVWMISIDLRKLWKRMRKAQRRLAKYAKMIRNRKNWHYDI